MHFFKYTAENFFVFWANVRIDAHYWASMHSNRNASIGLNTFGLRIIVYCFLLFFSFTTTLLADQKTDEHTDKAEFLYKFAHFVLWPNYESIHDQQSPFYICILGKNPFGNALEKIKKKNVKGRPFAILVTDSVDNLHSCQIVFVSRSKRNALKEILYQLEKQQVLTVSDIPEFIDQGGIINLLTVKRKIRIFINIEAAKKQNLIISSRLLKLATIVSRKE